MFKNLTVKAQLQLGFGVVLGLFALTLLVVSVMLSRLGANVAQINAESLPFVIVADEMNLHRVEVQEILTDVSLTHDLEGLKDADEAASNFMAGAAKFRAMFQREGDAESLKELDAIESSFKVFLETGKKMADTYIKDGKEAGDLLMKGSSTVSGFDTASEQLELKVTHFRDEQAKEARDLTADAEQAEKIIEKVMLGGGLAAGLVGAFIGFLIANGILNQLGGEPRDAAVVARQVGAGDLTARIELKAGDTTSLMANLKAMQDNLSMVVGHVRASSSGVSTASTQIAQGNHDLAHRTSSQASSLEQTAASMEELSAAVEHNANSASEANKLAQHATDVAQRGGEVVAEVVQTMTGINDASRKISDIIGVIDGIAFQTNILALNAAVEAARAGEQGRGFAVVAGEVRLLAGRSAEAAKEIKQLISASVEQVGQGTALVDQAGATMNDVVQSIRRVTDIVSEISTASHQQAMGVSQVGQAVTHMDEATQQNAALVEEMDAAATSLTMQAKTLMEAVDVFKLTGRLAAA